MTKISTNKSLLTGLMASAFCFATVSAHATTTTLLDENFNDATNTTIQSLLSSNPASLPTGTTWSSTTNANSVNLRLGSDAINTYNGLQRFALTSGTNFFLPATTANKFLVMGDDSGQLAGSPTAGTFGFATPFALAAGTTDITVSFDWVFSAFLLGSGGDTDQFSVGITGNGFNINTPLVNNNAVLNQSIAVSGKAYGPTSLNIAVASLGQADANGQYWLNFGYLENTSSQTNGAVGIDNIKITANVAPVPVPGAVWLLGSGLAGLLGLQRRKQIASSRKAN